MYKGVDVCAGECIKVYMCVCRCVYKGVYVCVQVCV